MSFFTCLRQFALAGAGCFSVVAAAAQAQAPDTAAWTRFEKKAGGGYDYGYRDASGRVRLPAIFGGFTPAVRFRHIMAVNNTQTDRSYYLLKNGRPVGVDSVYVSGDYEVACESEGAIVFRTGKYGRVGFLDGQGRVLIPAVYNFLTPFHNHLAVALQGAKRSCWEPNGDTLHCEHLSWEGGRQLLITPRHEVLAELPPNLPIATLNWYSLRRNVPTPDTATTVTFPAANGERLTFTDYKKEFRQWFFQQFVPAVRGSRAPDLAALCFEEITTAGRPFRGWSKSRRAAFVTRFAVVLHGRLAALQPRTPGLAVFDESLGAFECSGPACAPFWTDCGEHFKEKYPVFEVAISYAAQPGKAGAEHQEHFSFIRTTDGYRLFSVAL